MFTFIANEIESYRSKFGTMTPGILPVSGNTPFGLEVGALPSGRHAWKPLADGVSPNGGTDTEGPGAVLKSVSHLPHDRFVQGTLLNMKIEPEMLNSENGIMQMMALLKSMCSLGIFHVRFNVIDERPCLPHRKDRKNTEDFSSVWQGIRHILRNLGRMYRMRSLPGRNRNRYTAAVSNKRKSGEGRRRICRRYPYPDSGDPDS